MPGYLPSNIEKKEESIQPPKELKLPTTQAEHLSYVNNCHSYIQRTPIFTSANSPSSVAHLVERYVDALQNELALCSKMLPLINNHTAKAMLALSEVFDTLSDNTKTADERCNKIKAFYTAAKNSEVNHLVKIYLFRLLLSALAIACCGIIAAVSPYMAITFLASGLVCMIGAALDYSVNKKYTPILDARGKAVSLCTLFRSPSVLEWKTPDQVEPANVINVSREELYRGQLLRQ